MLENVKIQDKEKLKIHRKNLKKFQKEMRCIDLQNIDELQEKYTKYIIKHKPHMTLEQVDTVSEVFQFIRSEAKEDK